MAACEMRASRMGICESDPLSRVPKTTDRSFYSAKLCRPTFSDCSFMEEFEEEDYDLWAKIQDEARSDVEREPILSSYYHVAILCYQSLEIALANNLSLKLSSPSLPSGTLGDIFVSILNENEEIMEAVKVLIGEWRIKLSIPKLFVSSFHLTPKTVKLINASKRLWMVDMEKEEKDPKELYFKNHWPKFVKENALEDADFLLFKFDGNSTFEVVICGRTTCDKMLENQTKAHMNQKNHKHNHNRPEASTRDHEENWKGKDVTDLEMKEERVDFDDFGTYSLEMWDETWSSESHEVEEEYGLTSVMIGEESNLGSTPPSFTVQLLASAKRGCMCVPTKFFKEYMRNVKQEVEIETEKGVWKVTLLPHGRKTRTFARFLLYTDTPFASLEYPSPSLQPHSSLALHNISVLVLCNSIHVLHKLLNLKSQPRSRFGLCLSVCSATIEVVLVGYCSSSSPFSTGEGRSLAIIPSFRIKLQLACAKGGAMCIQTDFFKKYMRRMKQEVEMETEKGVWKVTSLPHLKRGQMFARFSRGWSEFARKNWFQVGETLLFRMIQRGHRPKFIVSKE
ncbi:hypothetical protein K1719_017776 [Acacia pycnantha]|nr:hypothetical protein K1719_017776 [Acacia pycnantha]